MGCEGLAALANRRKLLNPLVNEIELEDIPDTLASLAARNYYHPVIRHVNGPTELQMLVKVVLRLVLRVAWHYEVPVRISLVLYNLLK